MTSLPVGCAEAWHDLGLPRRCCISCHEDYEDYGYPLCGTTLADGREADVCCEVLVAQDECAVTETDNGCHGP